jgi:hypothetical protein
MHPRSEDTRLRVIFVGLLLVSAAVAAGGPLQVYFSRVVFWCGRAGAGPQLHILFALAAVQITLFLSAQYSARTSQLYRITQWLALILCAFQGLLLVRAYPTTSLFLGSALAGSFVVALIMIAWRSVPERHRIDQLLSELPYVVVLSVLLLVHWLVVSGLIAQFFLYHPAYPFTALPLAFSVLVGSMIAITGGWSFHRRNYERLRHLDLSVFPPLFVLLLALLRAKYPDGSYDALLYKGTWPYQIAQWRTAGMAMVDQYGLGTTFQEMFNGFLLILAPDYSPSLISTLSISALFLLLPCCINLANMRHGLSRLMFGFATAVIISLTEAAIDHGTVFQEPFMVLLLTLGLLNAWTWPVFLCAAMATKLTAIFAVPLIFVYKFVPADQSVVAQLWRQRLAIIAAVGLIGLFLWPQIDRNLIYSGRILGRTETLASWTDPPGPTQVLASGAVFFQPMPRGGLLNNFVLSTCNAFALDLFCTTAYRGDENAGFNVAPSSRAFLVGILLACATLAVTVLTRVQSAPALLGSLAFLIGYVAFLSMFAAGRFFVVPSFMLAGLVLCVSRLWSNAWASPLKSVAAILLISLFAIVPIGDLQAGTFINAGWNCKRNLFDRAGTYRLNRPQHDPRYGHGLAEEKFLQNLAARYRRICPPPGLSPTILETGGGDHWLLPYLGMEVADLSMIERFLNVDRNRTENVPLAALAIIVHDTAQLKQLTRAQSSEFTECFRNKDVQIFCSNRLAPRGRECTRSLYEGGGSFDAVLWLGSKLRHLAPAQLGWRGSQRVIAERDGRQ